MTETKDSKEDKEKLEEQIELTLKKLELIQRHIRHVQEACEVIGRKMIEAGEIDFGVKLIANSYLHDNSKMASPIEFNFLFQIEDKEMLKLAIHQHNHTNLHHPNSWGNIDQIDDLHLAELCADIFCRAGEMGSSIEDYLTEVYFPKYNIKVNSSLYKKMRKFMNMLVEKFQKI